MHLYLGVLLSNRTSPGGGGLGRRGAAREAAGQAEAILADHLVGKAVRVVTAAQPGAHDPASWRLSHRPHPELSRRASPLPSLRAGISCGHF